MSELQFDIGSVIYVLSRQSQKILPGIVMEEVHCKRLEGESVSYKIAVGPPGGQKIIDLTRVAGDVYGSLDEVREAMAEKILAYVDDVVGEAAQRAEAWYGQTDQSVASAAAAGPNDRVDPGAVLNEVLAAKPTTQTPANPNVAPRTTASRRAQAMTDPELFQRDFVNDDGTVQKVPINVNPKP